ncbi:hypothetical protein ABKV19_015710 [Rosa sericea]
MATVAVFIFSVFTHLLLLYSAESCPPYFCNERVGNISFPFKNKTHSPVCGLFTVNCSDHLNPKIQLKDRGYWFQLESISRSKSAFINDSRLQERIDRLKGDTCDDDVFNDLSLPGPSSTLDTSTSSLTLFRCNNTLEKTPYKDPNYACRSVNYIYYTVSNDSLECSAIQIPITPRFPSNVYNASALTAKFSLLVQVTEECNQCYTSNGACSDDNGEFKCAPAQEHKCWDDNGEFNCALAQEVKCQDDEDSNCFGAGNTSGLKLRIGIALGAGGLILVLVVICCFRRKLCDKYTFFWTNKNQSRQIVEEYLMGYGPLQVKRYSYLDVKKMTNSFKEKLGQGGYGGVYKGKLNDGCLVAVKILNRSKGNGEEFMNEVAAISRTSHVNVVSLLGFCFEGSERALIYEFMPNGSLEKFIFDANNPQKDHHLGWEALDRIALGIARGLEYLHRGCNTRILHFDIKPHNILLNENFSPKISDFGLAKICKGNESIVSMMGARGTAGYIAPEVFCRNFGGVSHKSDVYSYGMMLSEMVGGRKNISVEVEDTSEIYFPHWIYKRLELDQEFGVQSTMNEEDKGRARKMIIVSLWCIQTDPANRPAMKQVIEMLEGSVDSLQIPPKPYLYSPPKSQTEPAHPSSTLVSLH